MKYLIILLTVLMLSGCFFGRVDVEEGRTSVTVATLFKDIDIDPNSYDSKSNPVKVLTPWGIMDSK